MDHLRNFKGHIKQIVPMKQQELAYYKQFADFLQKYEESNERSKTGLGGGDYVKLVSGDSKAHFKHKLDHLGKDLANPFIHIRNWIKGEILNLNALGSAISAKEACDARKHQAV